MLSQNTNELLHVYLYRNGDRGCAIVRALRGMS